MKSSPGLTRRVKGAADGAAGFASSSQDVALLVHAQDLLAFALHQSALLYHLLCHLPPGLLA